MESGRMRRCEQWHLHCTSQWGQWRPLSEHVYLVAMAFKMTEQVEQWICSRFCVKLEHSSTKLCGWFRGPQLCTTGDLHLHHDNTATNASRLMQSILAKHQITQVTQHPYSPDLAPCGFWLFPKLKSPLKGKRFQTGDEIQENTMEQLMGIPTKDFAECFEQLEEMLRELCEVPRCLLWRGLRCHCPVYSVSCIFLNKCLYFSYYMAGYLLDRSQMSY